MPAAGTVIELKDVSYSYPLTARPAVRDINMQIENGRFYGIIGSNGSGKTTLCNIMRGFIPGFFKGTLKGQVLVDGKPAAGYTQGELALRIGYVFQNPFNQISGVRDTVFEEVAFGLENFGTPPGEIEERVCEVMKLTKIESIAWQNPFSLSGGQQQRVAIASILVLDPDIFIFDEPSSQLDPEGTESIFEIIGEMKKARKTIILAEHKVDLIAEYADEVFALKKGRIVKSGLASDVLSDLALAQRGIGLPQVALLGGKLIESGLPLPHIPTREAECADMLRGLLGRANPPDPQPQPNPPAAAGAAESDAAPLPQPEPLPQHQPQLPQHQPRPRPAYVSLKNASFTYPGGILAVDGVSLDIAKGESVAIIGQNGAGKTSLVKMINALGKPSGGTVTVAGMNTKDCTTAQISRVAGYVFQNPDDQIFHSTVLAEVAYGPKMLKLGDAAKKQLVGHALTVTGLSDECNTNPYDLPLSVRKFVTIASIIAMDSEVMIFDEPTAGQDIEGLERLSGILRSLHAGGKTLVTVTHDMEFTAENFDRVIVMADKIIIADGAPRDIFWNRDTLEKAALKPPLVTGLCRALGLGGKPITLPEAAVEIIIYTT